MIQLKKIKKDELILNDELNILIQKIESGDRKYRDVRYPNKPTVLEIFIKKGGKYYYMSLQIHEATKGYADYELKEL